MLIPQDRPVINAGEVIAKIMDGEAILINLSNGLYYSMDDTGGAIWALIERQYSLEEMAAWLVAQYHIPHERASTDIMRLVGELLAERLVVIEGGTASPTTDAPLPSQAEYSTPQLIKYTDMGDMLALDPPMPSLPSAPWRSGASESGR